MVSLDHDRREPFCVLLHPRGIFREKSRKMGCRGNRVGGMGKPQSVSGGEKGPGHSSDSGIFRLRRKGIIGPGLCIRYVKREQVGESCQPLFANSTSGSATRMGYLPMLPHLCPAWRRLRLILRVFLVLSQPPPLQTCTNTHGLRGSQP